MTVNIIVMGQVILECFIKYHMGINLQGVLILVDFASMKNLFYNDIRISRSFIHLFSIN